jgi:uncharacterized protein (DUF433 family)
MTTATAAHVWVDEKGVAWVDDTGHKVRQIVVDYLFNKWGPEAIHKQYPDLSLAQIHAALTYYYDNKAQVDEEIERCHRIEEEARANAGHQFARRELEKRLEKQKRR